MTVPRISTDRQRELLQGLHRLVAQRAKGEVEIKSSFASRDATTKANYATDKERLTEQYEEEKSATEAEYAAARAAIDQELAAATARIEAERDQARTKIKQQTSATLSTAKREWQLARHKAGVDFNSGKTGPVSEYLELKEVLDARWQELQLMEGQARWILQQRRFRPVGDLESPQEPELAGESDTPSPSETDAPGASPTARASDAESAIDRYRRVVAQAGRLLRALNRQPTAKVLEGANPFGVFVLLAVACAYPAALLFGWDGWHWVAASGGAAAALTVGLCLGLFPVAKRRSLALFEELRKAKVDAEVALHAALEAAKAKTEGQYDALVARRDSAVSEADAKWAEVSKQRTVEQETNLAAAESTYSDQLDKLQARRQQEVAALEAKYPVLLKELRDNFESELQQQTEAHDRQLAESKQRYEREWNDLVQRWTSGVADFRAAVDEMNRFCAERFPEWEAIDWNAWQPSTDPLPALRFGNLSVRLAKIDKGVPQDPQLAVPQTDFDLPAVLSFPQRPSLLLEGAGKGRDVAIHTIQDVMLRLLTSLPPGKVRFTIVDPTGLGQNFSAFMHLADYDERLVASRIWTESAHINLRLTDLTEHMEKVIQKYLRNEFESIQQYNEHAGEVAEPFQILVIANFPANFSEEAARRLVSIATSGARCGVYTLISTDTKLNLPRNFDLADLEAQAVTLRWAEGRFYWKDSELRRLPLALESPPDDECFTAAVRAAGQLAKDSSRVEVPFATVAPGDDQWWTCDSRSGIDVALGRAGATKLQSMALGSGTSQHVLISGKTGSGKSTLLHALITNLSLHYGPDEVHFYLVDFKKGVEFKAYARFGLPHARVIAIESEREFGMSVLERLDLELKRRGDLFREHAVQDLQGYRNANPDKVMPRVLLIIDEFQELFVKDDKIAQDASLLLDRLVRQGRAFGIHVLLGSQTLAGAYSLARSTIGQMAVRVALQCSEADAHLILSEDNTAARLLNRPGEAIYNDANGMFEGNHPFQVVWLPDEERERYLRKLRDLTTERKMTVRPPIVFEGNMPANPADNELLRGALESAGPTEMVLAPRAWLGSAVAIKDPTSVRFRRQSGSNLLIVGQDEEAAMGVLHASLVSLASQSAGPGDESAARFVILDGSRPQTRESDFWHRTTAQFPLDVRIASPRDTAAVIGELAAEVDRRLQASDDTAPPIFVVVYNLGRFRDLKKGEDDFGFSGLDDNKPAGPDKQFREILREGSSFGVHVLMWCDTYSNTSRWIDRQTLHDLEMRVVFQMGANDSSNLIDSPEAGRLGVHRALLYSEEQGRLERFRPYGKPTDEWLTTVQTHLASRSADTSPVESAE